MCIRDRSNNIPACTVKSISLKGVKYKGYHNWQAHGSGILPWDPDADTRDFTLDFPNGKEVAENTEMCIRDRTVSEWGTDDKNVDLKDSEKFDVTVDGWTDDTKDAPLK